MVILLALFGESLNRNITTFVFPFKLLKTLLMPCRRAGVIVLLFFCIEPAQAGFERTAQPPAVFGDGASSLFSGDVEPLLLNPSAAASLKSFASSFFYSPSPFDLPQLSTGGMFSAFPFESFTAGVAVTTAGFSLYREITATAIVAKSFGGIFSTGCNINFNHLAIARYGSALTIGIDVAASIQVADDLRWGVSLLNVNRPTIGAEKDELPQLYLTGVSCELLTNASVSFTLIKDVRYPLSVRTGARFSAFDAVDLRFGVSTEPSRYFAGVGIHYSSISFDYSVATDADLGLTHSIGISFGL
ncbi:MAG: hypothetical protein WBW71_12330 [Bacteroidota bacterium]